MIIIQTVLWVYVGHILKELINMIIIQTVKWVSVGHVLKRINAETSTQKVLVLRSSFVL